MRIAIITNLYPNPLQPNRATFNHQQFQALAKSHQVGLVVPVSWTDEVGERRKTGYQITSRSENKSGTLVEYPRYWFPPRVWRGSYGWFLQQSIQGSFQRIRHAINPQIVLGSWAYPDGWAAVRLARRSGLPAVIKAHGSDIHQLHRHPARRRATIQALQEADGIVAVSQDLADQIAKLGVKTEKIAVVYNGIDKTRFSPGSRMDARNRLGWQESSPLILFIGNLVEVKRPRFYLEILAKLANQGVSFRAVLAGQGPLRADLEQKAKDWGLAEQVHFLGSVPHETIPDWLRAANVLVLTSENEGVPNVLLEATACETPWVASRAGGIPEIVRSTDHRLASSDDVNEFADAIADLLSRNQESAAPVSKTITSWDESANQLANVLNRCIK